MQSTGSLEHPGPVVATTDSGATNTVTETCVLFLLDEQTYALGIDEVERIIRAVEVTPLPETPPHVRGIVNVQGQVLPVIDLRARFGLPPRDLRLEDHFIIARMPTHSVILPVDAALGSLEVLGGFVPHDDEAHTRCVRNAVPVGLDVVYALDLQRVVFIDQSPADSDLASVFAELQQL